MIEYDNPETKMKWLVIDIATIEEASKEELRDQIKKRIQNIATVIRSQINSEEVDATTALQMENQMKNKIATQQEELNAIKIPHLEKYTNYSHPNPLWLFMKDNQILYEVHSANPPKIK